MLPFTTLHVYLSCTPDTRIATRHQMYNQGYNVYTHISHTDFSTDLSWNGLCVCVCVHTHTRCVHVLTASFPGLYQNIRERGPLPTPSPGMTIHYRPGLCYPPQYNTLKTHQFLLGTVSLVAAFHCTHSPTRNGIHPQHQNIRFSNIKVCVHDN